MGFRFPWDRVDERVDGLQRSLCQDINEVLREMKTLDRESDRRIVDVNDRVESVAKRVHQIERKLSETQKVLSTLYNIKTPAAVTEKINTRSAVFLYVSCVLSSAFAAVIACGIMLGSI